MGSFVRSNRFRLLHMLLAALLLCVVIFARGGIAPAYAADKTVALPSPEDYFGETDCVESGKNNIAYSFYGYPTFPKSKVEAYVNALKSFGLRPDTDTIGSLVNLKSNGKRYVQIYWTVSEKQDGGYIRVNFVQPYVAAPPSGVVGQTSEQEESVIILSPTHYFGEVDRVVTEENSTILYFDGFRENPKKEMQTYVEAFKAAGFTGFIVARSGGDREAAMKFAGVECLWLLWDESEKCIRLEMLNSLTSDDEVDPDASLPEIMEKSFGNIKNVEYDAIAESLIYDFSFSSYPASEMEAFLKALEAWDFTAEDPFTSSSGTSKQNVCRQKEICLVIWWLPKTEKLEITVYLDAAKEAGILKDADIPEPAETEPTKPASTEPKPTEAKPTEPAPTKPAAADAPNAVTNIIRSIFGTPSRTDYKEDRYETRMYYSSPSEPKAAFSAFRTKMESLGLKVYNNNFSKRKEVTTKAEGGTPVMASWKKNAGEIEVTIKWEYIVKSGVFDMGEVPVRTPQETTPNPGGDKVRCNVCFGTDKCPQCGGSGEVEKSLHGKPWVKVQQTCNRCWGTKKCDSCDKGWVDP